MYLFREFSYTQDNNNNATAEAATAAAAAAATDAMARLCHTWPALASALAFGQGRHLQWLPLQEHTIFTSVYS